jgi:hypothetical protein
MQDRNSRLSRRKFLAGAAALTIASSASAKDTAKTNNSSCSRPPRPSIEGRKPIAVITTVYRPLSHAFHITARFLHGYVRNGEFHVPQHFVRSICVEQTPDNDLSREIAKDFGCKWTKSVADALLDGNRLAVDGVLLIAEHGNYPRNDKGQILYPRFELFEKIVAAFRKAGKSVPVFCDKHLSYQWDRARQMVEWSRELKFPLLAGSSLPVTWRRPELELPLQSPIDEALVAAYGPLEVYGIHALETLQCMVERRRGGETGIRSVTCLTGNDVWRAGDDGKWSWDLLESALRCSESVCPGDIRRNVGLYGAPGTPIVPATAFLIEYRDGTRGTALLLNGHIQDFVFACRLRGESKIPACLFHLPPPPGARFFDGQVMNIERLLAGGTSPYPSERTLMTSGALDALLTSHERRGQSIETPQLDLSYSTPADSGFIRGPVAVGG